MTTSEHLDKIKAIVNQIKNADSPDLIADLRLDLSSWKVWLGERKVEAEMAYNRKLNEVMTQQDLPANKAMILVKAGEEYQTLAIVNQLYKDVQTVVSAAKSKIQVLSESRY